MSVPQSALATSTAQSPPAAHVFRTLLPITLAVFISFLSIGLPLPVLPLHVHNALEMSTLVVGLVIGAQFAAALFSRAWAGNLADTQGAKHAMMLGLMVMGLSGLTYMASLSFITTPTLSVWVLVIGRILLGCGESLIVTGALSWGIGLVGPQNAGKVMAWVGVAMYGAYAVGAPIGVAVNQDYGFEGISIAGTLLPLLSLPLLLKVRATAPTALRRTPFYKVLSLVWGAGMGLLLCSVGFGSLTAFVALLFADRNWGNASLAFPAFGVAFIAARMLFGHLPDKLGGARVALLCVLIEAVGLLLIWGAQSPAIAYLGAALTGWGYSLAFPGFGVEAVRRAPPESRGVAMGAYVAFLDISLGITGPALGAIAGAWGIGAIYLVSALVVSLSVFVAIALMRGANRKSTA
ncbi:MAG TPA: arabinose transporter [Alcaligenes faecalis]|nr:arabinose transporter [Alcaligenes faecalis]